MSDAKTEVIELVISEHQLLTYAMLAHEQDITLNQWFINAALSYHPEDTDNVKADSNK